MPPITKDPQIKISVSIATFNEISAALEKQGFQLGVNVASIVLERNIELEPPIDYRMATIRKDAGIIAARAWKFAEDGRDFVDFMNDIFEFIIKGKEEGPFKPIQSKWK